MLKKTVKRSTRVVRFVVIKLRTTQVTRQMIVLVTVTTTDTAVRFFFRRHLRR